MICPVDAAEATRPANDFAVVRFEMHASLLMNLHHMLYDAGRHPGRLESAPWAAAADPQDLAALRDAAASYGRQYASRDLLFDDGMRDIKHALSAAGDEQTNPRGLGLPPALEATLASAAPAYARAAWPAQRAVDRARMGETQALEQRYGTRIQRRLERIFGQPFPAAIRVDFVVETGSFAGGYTDAPPPQTVLPAGRPEYGGPAALEMLWHEASHAGPADALEIELNDAIRAARRAPADQLWHAAQFWAVGEVVRELLAADGVDETPYAQRNGVYRRAWPQWLPLLETDWQRWVEKDGGKGTRAQAIAAMVARLPAAD